MTKSNRGFLIDFEGIDGSGKTTHVSLTKEWLESLGKSVVNLKEPTKGAYGQRIAELASKKILKPDEELELFILDRQEDVSKNILPSLNKNEIVLMDRYYFSNIAYQAARGLNFNDIKAINEEFSPEPDLIIVLDISPIKGMERVNERKNTVEHFENVNYLEKVRTEFLKIGKLPNAVIIISDRPADKVQEDIQKVIKEKLPAIFN